MKMEVPLSFEMLGTTHPMAEHQMPDNLIPHQHHCENVKSYDDKLYSDIFAWHVWN